MYIDMKNLRCHVIPEGKGFLAYVHLGNDENGKRIRPKARGKSEDDAVAQLEKKLRDMGYVQPETNAPKQDIIINQFTPVPDFVREYRVNYIMSRVEKEEIASRTAENYYYSIKPFEKYFQRITVGEITTDSVNQFFNAKASEKSGDKYIYSQVTLNRIEFIVHNMFKRAVENKWISLNPFDSMNYKRPKSKKVTEKIEGFDPNELKEVIEVIKDYPIIYAPISLMLNTGMRTQEVLALRWSNINFEDNTVKVEHAVTVEVEFDDDGNIKSRASVIGNTKTKWSQRLIGLTPDAKRILLDWREIAPSISKTGLNENDFVFGYERKPSFTYNAFRDRVNDYLARQSEGVDKMRLHRFRHTVATLLAAEGREVYHMMRQLGITQEKTLNNYVDKKGNKKIMDGNVYAISKGLSEIVGEKPRERSIDTDNPIIEAILKEAEGLTDSKAKALIKALVELRRGE